MGGHFRIVGLLGGVASGKSTVAAEFEKLGAAILDADRIAHKILTQPEYLKEIAKTFGQEVLTPEGNLDRKKMAAIVFQDEKKRRELESIVHPGVRKEIEAGIAKLRQENKVPFVILDVPLLIEGGLIQACDLTVFVDSPAALRKKRVAEKRGWNEHELELREKAQGDLETKKRRANFLVNNAGSMEDIQRQVKEVFQQIVKTN